MTSSASVNHERLEEGLQSLLGRHAAAICRTTNGDLKTLTPVERLSIERAIAIRQNEFAAGRAAAREAMHRLGRPPVAIRMQDDRSPLWPADLVGSISHCRKTCISVVALKPHWHAVGVDVEEDRDLSPELWNSICVSNELLRAEALPEDVRARWIMRIFSAKEAYYKWIYPQMPRLFDFHEVEIFMGSTLESTEFRVSPLHRENIDASFNLPRGKLMVDQGMLISLMIN